MALNTIYISIPCWLDYSNSLFHQLRQLISPSYLINNSETSTFCIIILQSLLYTSAFCLKRLWIQSSCADWDIKKEIHFFTHIRAPTSEICYTTVNIKIKFNRNSIYLMHMLFILKKIKIQKNSQVKNSE